MADPDPDLGKASRDDYEKNHPAEEKEHPEYDKAYLDGEKQPDPGSGLTKPQVEALRKKLAEKASRYDYPASGFVNGDPRKGPKQGAPGPDAPGFDPATQQIDGGGVYLKPGQAARLTDKQICDNVYHWVEDMFWPKGAEPKGTDRDKLDRNWGKADEIDKGGLDIGKRVAAGRKSKWYCGEQAQFLAWLMRQLGYKVQYKNIVPSTAASKPPNDIDVDQQTAAIDVWYDGAWHLYDPFESFSDADGGLDAYVNKKGDVAAPYSDAYVYRWERGDYDHFTWDAPTEPGTEAYLDNHMRNEGWTRHKYIPKQAGASLRNTRANIRLGLGAGEAYCGWFGKDDVRESWIGARYRPFGRSVAPSMGSLESVPARDERIDLNIGAETSLAMTLVVTNIGASSEPFAIEAVPCSSEYLRVRLDAPAMEGTLAPGQSKAFELALQAKRVAWPPPSPVTGVRGRLHRGRVYLSWNETPGASLYRVYRRDREILSSRDLAKARFLREVPLPGFEAAGRFAKPVFFAVIAVDARGAKSELDVEEGSSCVVTPARKPPRKSPRKSPRKFPKRRRK